MLVEWELQDHDATQSARMLIPKIVASRLELAMGFATGLYELAEHFTVLEWISAELFLEVQKLILCIYILTETLGKPGYLHQVFFSRVRSEPLELLDRRFQAAAFCPRDVRFLEH